MARTAFRSLASPLMLIAVSLAPAVAATRSADRLLPPTTKGYLSVPDVDLLRERWSATQLAALTEDPLMKPFLEDMRQQIESRVGQTDTRLNIKLEDLQDVYGGEVCLATIQPGNDPKQHALTLIVDVTGHREQAESLLASIREDLVAQGSQFSEETIRGVALRQFVLPRKRGETKSRHAFYFLHEDVLVASDHEGEAKGLLERCFAEDAEVLRDAAGYAGAMAGVAAVDGDATPHVHWFIEPLGYVTTIRAASGGRQRRGTDLLKVLANQGFDAIQGLGGTLTLSTDGKEIVHRTFVHAPRIQAEGDKYRMAMRMLNFPNTSELSPQPWVPAVATNYLTFCWKMQDAFEHSRSLVDEVAGAPVFDDILDSLKNDPNGPRVDLRSGLVALLGERATFFTDFRLPVTVSSERWLLALELTGEETVAATLDKAMEADPDARRRQIGVQTVWEIVEQAAEEEVEELDIAGPGFGDFGEEEMEEEQEDRGPLLSHAAFAVAHGHLLVASHLDYMEEVLTQGVGQPALSETRDHVRVEDALRSLGAGENSFRFFTRTDKSYRPTYELIRQGKMPESESLFGNLLNRIYGSDEEGVVRQQQIKGERLPEFEQISGYLGPAGAFVRSSDDGWLVVGCLLTKMGDGTEASGPMVSRRVHERR